VAEEGDGNGWRGGAHMFWLGKEASIGRDRRWLAARERWRGGLHVDGCGGWKEMSASGGHEVVTAGRGRI
jgi:hypothetical protein